MNDSDFLYHLKLIQDILKHKHVRMILLHPPYTEKQQKTIDSICRNSRKIIGQLERKPPILDVSGEILKMIESHHEPFIDHSKIQYVILGKTSSKII